MTILSREDWLASAYALHIRELLASKAELSTQDMVNVSCSFPAHNALPSRGGYVIGQCWHSAICHHQGAQIFISPLLTDTVDVLATLAHEAIHAALPLGTGHKAAFAEAAKAIGLEGPATATYAGDVFKAWAADVIRSLGVYPHGGLDLSAALGGSNPFRGPILSGPLSPESPRIRCGGEGPSAPDTARQLKVTCSHCGNIARQSQSRLNALGAPLCPCNGEPMVPGGRRIELARPRHEMTADWRAVADAALVWAHLASRV